MDGVRGAFKELEALATAMAGLGEPSTRLELSHALAEEARTQALIGFRRGVDPDDKPWPKLRSRTGQPLRDSGRLQNSVTGKAGTEVRENGFTISTDVFYAAVHQYGATIKAKNPRMRFGGAGTSGMDTVTAGKPMLVFRVGGARPRGHGRGRTGGWVSKAQVTIPKRQIMPEGELGPRWSNGLEDQAAAFVQQRVGGKP